MSRVAVIGAGVAGLVAAYRLTGRGIGCDVYERWPGLGGQAASVDAGGGVLLDRYYHHLFQTDRHMRELCEDLGVAIDWLPSSVAVFTRGEIHPFTTPLDLLRFEPLPPPARIRLGLATLWLRSRRDIAPFERITAHEWITRHMGRGAWDVVWGPLLHGKFGDRAEEISMAWIWSKLSIRRGESRTEVLGYPRGSFQPIFDALAQRIEAQGGRLLIDRPAARIERDGGGLRVTPAAPGSFRRGHDPRRFETVPETDRYDAVLATVPSDVFEALCPDLPAVYAERLRSIEYHATACLLLELDRRFTPFYWTNIADPEIDFVGLIEQSNFADYGGRRFLYVANYVERGHPLLDLDLDALLARYEPGLRRVNPGFERSWVKQAWLFREPAAQPVVTLGYPDRIPPLETGVPGLLLANTTQIYPEDRGTNYSVRLGGEAAAGVLRTLG